MERRITISRSLEIGLRITGLWPDSAYPILYSISCMTVILIVQYFQYAYVIAHADPSNLSLLMDSLSLSLAHTHCLLKFLFLWRNRRVFYYIMTSIKQDWRECAVSDMYLSTMLNAAHVSRRCTNLFISVNTITAFFVSVGGYFLQSVLSSHLQEDELRKSTIKVEVPFEISKSPIFECFLLGRFLFELSIASSIALVNALLVTLILHVSAQIDIIHQELRKISNGKCDRNVCQNIIKSIICRHQKIITLAENIEYLFCYISLLELLWNTWVSCCTAFTIIITINAGQNVTVLIKAMCFYIAIVVELFIFCYSGEYLSAKCKSINNAVYETLWYDMAPTDSRALLFVMLRCQKRLTITAGKVIDLTLESFTSIMKASASYTSVLNAMQ